MIFSGCRQEDFVRCRLQPLQAHLPQHPDQQEIGERRRTPQ